MPFLSVETSGRLRQAKTSLQFRSRTLEVSNRECAWRMAFHPGFLWLVWRVPDSYLQTLPQLWLWLSFPWHRSQVGHSESPTDHPPVKKTWIWDCEECCLMSSGFKMVASAPLCRRAPICIGKAWLVLRRQR